MTWPPGASGTRKQFGDLFAETWTTHCEKILGYEPAPDVGPTPCGAGHDCDCSAQGPGGRRSSRRDFVRVGRCSTPESRTKADIGGADSAAVGRNFCTKAHEVALLGARLSVVPLVGVSPRRSLVRTPGEFPLADAPADRSPCEPVPASFRFRLDATVPLRPVLALVRCDRFLHAAPVHVFDVRMVQPLPERPPVDVAGLPEIGEVAEVLRPPGAVLRDRDIVSRRPDWRRSGPRPVLGRRRQQGRGRLRRTPAVPPVRPDARREWPGCQ